MRVMALGMPNGPGEYNSMTDGVRYHTDSVRQPPAVASRRNPHPWRGWRRCLVTMGGVRVSKIEGGWKASGERETLHVNCARRSGLEDNRIVQGICTTSASMLGTAEAIAPIHARD